MPKGTLIRALDVYPRALARERAGGGVKKQRLDLQSVPANWRPELVSKLSTCPTRALCTGRISEYKLFLLVAILVLAVATGCTGRRCCSDCWPSSAALPYFQCGNLSFKFKQGSGRLSRSAKPKGRLKWRLRLYEFAIAVPIFCF